MCTHVSMHLHMHGGACRWRSPPLFSGCSCDFRLLGAKSLLKIVVVALTHIGSAALAVPAFSVGRLAAEMLPESEGRRRQWVRSTAPTRLGANIYTSTGMYVGGCFLAPHAYVFKSLTWPAWRIIVMSKPPSSDTRARVAFVQGPQAWARTIVRMK